MDVIVEQSSDDLTAKWVPVIQAYERESEHWTKRAKKIIKRYKDEREGGDTKAARFNVLWSNIETLKPALYAQTPKPEVERRFKDADPTGRIAADVLERCLAYSLSNNSFGSVMRQGVLDYLLTGRGTAWVRYKPHMRDAVEDSVEDDGVAITEDDEIEPAQEVYYEEALPDYVHWEDFGHTVARVWEEVSAVWRRVYLTREQLITRFGEKAREVPLDWTPKGLSDQKIDDTIKKATIYEIWDRDSKKAIWLSKNHPEVLDERDDPLQLEKFFPCPKPIHATMGNDSLIPVPDYVQYQDQAGEMDELTGRIAAITKAIKIVGVYDASAEGVQRILSEGTENQLIPVDQWAVHAEKGGLKGVMELLPVMEIAQTLLHLYEAREKVKADLYEITGMSDIIRGATNANETATAQKIKSNFVTLRLSEKQKEIQRFARNVIEIMGQVIAGHFSIDTIKQISGVQLLTDAEKQQIQQMQAMQQQMAQQQPQGAPPPHLPQVDPAKLKLLKEPSWEQVDALLKDNAARSFRIDIETDSTIAADESQMKQDRMELADAVGNFCEKLAQSPPGIQPMLGEVLLYVVRGFKVGKNLESMLETMVEDMAEAAKQPPQPPQPDPTKMAEIQAKTQSDQANMQASRQSEMQKMQMAAQQKQAELQAAQQADAMKMQYQVQADQAKAQADAAIAQSKVQHDQHMAAIQSQMAEQQHQREMDFNRWKAELEASTKIMVAEISAKATLDAPAAAAEQAAAENETKALGGELVEKLTNMHMDTLKALTGVADALSKPKTIVRDSTGRMAGVK